MIRDVVEKILGWRHTGFNVHSQVRAQTKSAAERIGKYMIRYYGLYSNAHRGKIRKVYEADPLYCPACSGRMRIISFIEEPKTLDRIIRHLELTFEAERPPPPRVLQQELLIAAEESGEYI
jgi:hypothetical protein